MPLFTTRPALESLAIAIASSSESYATTLSTRPKISSQASVISFFTFTTSAVAVGCAVVKPSDAIEIITTHYIERALVGSHGRGDGHYQAH